MQIIREANLRYILLEVCRRTHVIRDVKQIKKIKEPHGIFYTHGYADRTTLSRGRPQSALSHNVPFQCFNLAQVFDVEHERRLAGFRAVPLQEELTLSVVGGDGRVVVDRHDVHVAPAVVLRPVFRSGVLVVEILKTGRQRFHHLVGSCGEKQKTQYYVNNGR